MKRSIENVLGSAWLIASVVATAHRRLAKSSLAYRQASVDALTGGPVRRNIAASLDVIGNLPSPLSPTLSLATTFGRRAMYDTNFPRGALFAQRRTFLGANLDRATLIDCTFVGSNFAGSKWENTQIDLCQFEKCRFSWTRMAPKSSRGSNFRGCELRGGLLSGNFDSATFFECRFSGVQIGTGLSLKGAQFIDCRFDGVGLSGLDLSFATFSGCDLTSVDLSKADLTGATLANCNLRNANLNDTTIARLSIVGCEIYGISVWGTRGEVADARGLRLSPCESGHFVVEVDGLHTAVFALSLLFGNGVRDLIDGLSSALVLVLGRFDAQNKVILDAIRAALRGANYAAIIFDTALPRNRDLSESVSVLARLARFVIVDITDPKSSPYELLQFVPECRTPVQAVVRGQTAFSMFKDLYKYPWVLPLAEYESAVEIGQDLPRLVGALEATRLRMQDR